MENLNFNKVADSLGGVLDLARKSLGVKAPTADAADTAWAVKAWGGEVEAIEAATKGKVVGRIGRLTNGVPVSTLTRSSSTGLSAKPEFRTVQFTVLPGEKQSAYMASYNFETGEPLGNEGFFETEVDLRIFGDNFPGRSFSDLLRGMIALRRVGDDGREFFSARKLLLAFQAEGVPETGEPMIDKKGRPWLRVTWAVVIDLTPTHREASAIRLGLRPTVVPTPEGGWGKVSRPSNSIPAASPEEALKALAAAAGEEAPF